MRVGLYNLEPKIFNTALMQVSQYHKQKGDQVELYSPLYRDFYNKVYVFSLFDFTQKPKLGLNWECGGSGFDLVKTLPKEIEECEYDYSIFPDCKTSYVWFSRGCIRSCPFCIVRKKEGYIHSVRPKNLNPNGEYITVMDNNFFANPEWKDAVKQLKQWNKKCDFQGVDVRLMDQEKCEALNSLKHYKQIKMAWDNPKEDLLPKFKEIIKFIKPYKLMVYVLIGFNTTPKEDLYRVEALRDLDIDPFVMPFDRKDKYQRDFARWVNFKAIFKRIPWEAYRYHRAQSISKGEDGIPPMTEVKGILPTEL